MSFERKLALLRKLMSDLPFEDVDKLKDWMKIQVPDSQGKIPTAFSFVGHVVHCSFKYTDIKDTRQWARI